MAKGGWGWNSDDDEPTPDEERLIANSRRSYDRIREIVERARADPSSFVVTPTLVCELHGIIMAGDPEPRNTPGMLRTEDVQIGGSYVSRACPPWQQVPEHLETHCRVINERHLRESTLDAAAYALWSINWIHPFGDGNGRTARAVMYAILCVGYGRMIPGETALPDLIRRTPIAYTRVLIEAHTAWDEGRGAVDISAVAAFVGGLLEQVFPEINELQLDG